MLQEMQLAILLMKLLWCPIDAACTQSMELHGRTHSKQNIALFGGDSVLTGVALASTQRLGWELRFWLQTEAIAQCNRLIEFSQHKGSYLQTNTHL